MDQAAVQKLKAMTDFLDGLQQFSVNSQSTVEELHESGHRIDRDFATSLSVKRPNKLRAARAGNSKDPRFFYDGKNMMLYSPAGNIHATAPAPDSIEATIAFARETLGILLPAADLLYRNVLPLLMQDVTLAMVVGKTVVGGVPCDHLLLSRPGVDVQIWIAEGKQPVPRKYVVTETGTPALLSITTVMSDWNTAPAVNDAQFIFVPPKGASPSRFIPPAAPRTSGR